MVFIRQILIPEYDTDMFSDTDMFLYMWTLQYNLDASVLKGAFDYNYKHLQLATNNFSEENSIGKGGFGEVFKVNN